MRVTVILTDAEYAEVKKRAGMVPLSRWIRNLVLGFQGSPLVNSPALHPVSSPVLDSTSPTGKTGKVTVHGSMLGKVCKEHKTDWPHCRFCRKDEDYA